MRIIVDSMEATTKSNPLLEEYHRLLCCQWVCYTCNVTYKTCAFCSKRAKHMKKCSGCNIARYCGEACQTLDWNTHREFCKWIMGHFDDAENDDV